MPLVAQIHKEITLLQLSCQQRCAEVDRACARLANHGRPPRDGGVAKKQGPIGKATARPHFEKDGEQRGDAAGQRCGRGRASEKPPAKPLRGRVPANHVDTRIQQKHAQREEARPTRLSLLPRLFVSVCGLRPFVRRVGPGGSRVSRGTKLTRAGGGPCQTVAGSRRQAPWCRNRHQ